MVATTPPFFCAIKKIDRLRQTDESLDALVEVLTVELRTRIEGRPPECSVSHWTDAVIQTHQRELQWADQIFLVGKTFQNSDREMNAKIRFASCGKEKERLLHIIDPNVSADCDAFHCDLFNAQLGGRWATLEEFVEKSGRG